MELVPNTFPALCIAYGVVWAVLTIYIITLGRRLTSLERKVDERSKSKE